MLFQVAALRLAGDEGVLPVVPRARLLPADDTQEVVPPSDEQFQHLLRVCENFREEAPFLPEVVMFAAVSDTATLWLSRDSRNSVCVSVAPE